MSLHFFSDELSPRHNFSARVTLDCELAVEIEVWVHELIPTAPDRRSVTEWVEEHLASFSRERFTKMLPEEAKTDCNLQILFTGHIQWSKSYEGEYDENIYPDEVKFQQLPDDWFEEEEPIQLPPPFKSEFGSNP